MSNRNSVIGLGVVLVVGGAVAWWGLGLGESQNQTQEPSQITAQAKNSNFNQAQATLENERNTIDVVQRTGDGVVFVSVRSAPAQATGNDFFSQFMQQQPSEGTGSGFVIDSDGLVLTNYHVVEDVAANGGNITIRFHNDPKSYTARIVGTAQPLDLALIKVQAPKERLRPMPLGNSDTVKVGQKAIAMGNPFGLEFTVTEGIISAIRRNPGAIGDGSGLVPSVLQTDAAINPGNSGGPLLNSKGEVVGINTAIYSASGGLGGQAQSAGIGFSIPINLVKQYLPDLKAGKKIDQQQLIASRPRFGVQLAVVAMSDYPNQIRQQNKLPSSGLMIASVDKGGPAAKAGLRASSRNAQLQTQGGTVELPLNGDVILEADGNAINDISDLRAVLLSKQAGQAVALKIWRNGQTLNVQVIPQIIK